MGTTVLIFFIFVMLDQITKFLTVKSSLGPQVQVVIPNFLGISKVYNTGAAWGAFGNNTIFLTIISFLAMIVMMYFATKNDWKRNKVGSFALTLALAGCVGNLIDRFFTSIGLQQGVIDMITWTWWDWLCERFGGSANVFNLADFFLIFGVILFIVDYIFFRDRKLKKYEIKKNKLKEETIKEETVKDDNIEDNQ